MFNKNKVVFVFFIAGALLVSAGVYSQTMPDFGGFGGKALDYHFSRADRETDPLKWLEEARKGIASARLLWEEMLCEMSGDPSMREEFENDFSSWSESEIEKRFSLWLMQRFFVPGAMSFNSAAAIEAGLTGKEYIYQLSPEGEILRDEYTGQPLLIRLHDTERDFETDLEEWRESVTDTVNTQTSLYTTMLEGLHPELLIYISEDKREGFLIKLRENSAKSVNLLRAEFQNMLAREERYLTARRTGDIQSLRKQSEDESAGSLTSKLIAEAKYTTDEGIKALAQQIEAAENGTGSLILYGEEWLSLYKEQFERGMKAWEEAEERFFIRRIEWEYKAGIDYEKGEKAWNRAFTQFEEARLNWEMQVKGLFDSAESLFAKASADLEKAIRDAADQMAVDASLRSAAGADRAKAWADIYITSAATAVQAKENIEQWQDRLKDEKNIIKKATIKNEINNWTNIYNSYYAKAMEARDALLDEFSMIMGSGELLEILNNGVSSEDFFLDEYQIELLRSKRVLEYWKKQASIAEAVLKYAQDLTAGRITEGEGMAAWEKAKNDYETYLGEYEKTLEELNSFSGEIGEAIKFMNEAAEKLNDYDKDLRILQDEYTILQDIYLNGEDNLLLAEINAKKEEFETIKALLDSYDASSHTHKYINALVAMTSEINNAARNGLVKELVMGSEYFDKSLSELYNAANEIRIPIEIAGPSPNAGDYGLKENNPCYPLLENLLAARKEADNIQTANTYDRLILETVSFASSLSNMELETRLLQLKLLSCSTAEDYLAYIDYLYPEEIYMSLQQLMAEHYKNSIRLDLEALQIVMQPHEGGNQQPGTSTEIYLLSGFFDFDNELAGEAYNELNAAYSAIIDCVDYEEILFILNKEAYEKQFVAYYLAAGSFFNSNAGVGFKDLLLKDELLAIEHYRNLMTAIAGTGIYSPGFERLIMQSYQDKLDLFYSSIGLDMGTFIIPDIDELNSALTSSGKDTKKLIEEYQNLLETVVFYLYEGFYDEYYQITLYLNALSAGNISENQLLTENAKRSSKIINEYYTHVFGTGFQSSPDIENLIKHFLENPLAAWKPEYLSPNNIDNAVSIYNESIESMNTLRYYEKILGSDIAGLEIKYGSIDKDIQLIETRVNELGTLINEKEADYERLLLNYRNSADYLAETGNEYDTLYKTAGDMAAIAADKEFIFEIQDAIKRWADTSYLDAGKPLNDVNDFNNRVTMAEKAIVLLKSLYATGETVRKYNNSEYNELLAKYNEAMEDYYLLMKADKTIREQIEKETNANNKAFSNLLLQMAKLGGQTENSFRAGDNILFDYFKISNNNISFAYNSGFKLIVQENSEDFREYFARTENFSSFETALLALNQRLKEYNFTRDKYIQWGMARDYLIRQLVENNPNIDILKEYASSAGNLLENSNLKNIISETIFQTMIYNSQKYAWTQLSDTEKQDLEFYTILTLFDSEYDPNHYFMTISEYREYRTIVDFYTLQYEQQKDRGVLHSIFWFFAGNDPLDEAKAVLNNARPALYAAEENVSSSFINFTRGINAFDSASSNFNESSTRLQELFGIDPDNFFGNEWENIKFSLSRTNQFNAAEMARMESLWENFGGGIYLNNILDAIAYLVSCGRETAMAYMNILDEKYNNDEQVMMDAYSKYLVMHELFIAGECTEEALLQQAMLCFGENSAAVKPHLVNIGSVIAKGLLEENLISKNSLNYMNEISSYFVSLIENTYTSKYQMEFLSRNLEWDIKRTELYNRYGEWKNSASSILENGREQWKNNGERLKEEYQEYTKRFIAEYKRMDEAWDSAYYEGLKNKEDWLKNVEIAVNNAASDVFVNMIGAEAESRSRVFDINDPFYTLNDSGYDAIGSTVSELLKNTGIQPLESLLNSASLFIGNTGYAISGRLGGSGLWNNGIIANEAARIAHKANEEIKAREAAKLAYNVKEIADESLKNITLSVEKTNIDVKNSFDRMFIYEGQWGRSGSGYVKEVLVHSTLFESIITERVNVDGYTYYKMPYLVFSVDTDKILGGSYNSIEIQNLADSIYNQTKEFVALIFGAPDSENKGEFFIHLGTNPETKKNPDVSKGKSGVFDDFGTGETGRLGTEYQYWLFKEANGFALMQLPFWEKPMWDSRNSSFSAPSIKSVVDIGLQVVGATAGFLTGGASIIASVALLNTADDILFGAMDLAFGYKTLGEVSVSIGKSALTNTLSAASGSLFGGWTQTAADLTSSTIAKGAIKVGMAGIQTISTGTINSAIANINYTSDGWSFSKDGFYEGFIGSVKGSLVSMTGVAATSVLNHSLEGFTNNRNDLYTNGVKLNNLLGQLAGQGVNYALNGDFALNIFNLGLIDYALNSDNRNLFDSNLNFGLIEMHLGNGGMKMNLGTGGADISIGSLYSSVKGFETISANLRILFSGEKDAVNYASAMRTLYSGSETDRNEFLNYIKGKTKIAYWDEEYTRSEYNQETGIKTVYLGTDTVNDLSRFGINVVLSHEAYRNGIVGSKEEQAVETGSAVIGHNMTAINLMNTYGVYCLGMDMYMEAILMRTALANNDYEKISKIISGYDPTGEYWRLTNSWDGSHSLEYDGNKNLTVVYLDEKGKVIPYKNEKDVYIDVSVPENQDFINSMGLAESLAAVIGLERAQELLGKDLNDASNYSFETLRDVLGPNYDIEEIQRSGVLPEGLTDKQLRSLAGEALLINAGANWNGSQWINTGGVNLTLTDRNLASQGNLYAVSNGINGFDYFTLTAAIYRDPESYKGWGWLEPKANRAKQALDIAVFTQYDLNGNVISNYIINGLQTVDNITKTSKNPNLNQPYTHPVYGDVQGNTIAPGVFSLTFYSSSSSDFLGVYGGIDNAVLVINNAKTISGITINSKGYGGGDTLRWLVHSNRDKDADKDYGSYSSDGCFIPSSVAMNSMLDYMGTIGLSRGYQIKTALTEISTSGIDITNIPVISPASVSSPSTISRTLAAKYTRMESYLH